MGIDPGLTRCGIGVVEVNTARRLSLVSVQVARSDPQSAVHFRLRTIGQAINEAIELYQPEVVAIERVFAKENLQSVTTTMQVMGVAMYCVAQANLPLAIHTPSEVKAAVSGSGSAPKSQVQHMVARILSMEKAPRPADAADALAIAICQAWRGGALAGDSFEGQVDVSLSGKVRARGALTPAQRQWAGAVAQSRRSGVADPRREKRNAPGSQ